MVFKQERGTGDKHIKMGLPFKLEFSIHSAAPLQYGAHIFKNNATCFIKETLTVECNLQTSFQIFCYR